MEENTHPLHAKISHCFCCLLRTFKDPFVSPEDNIRTYPTCSGHSAQAPSWDGVGWRGRRSKQRDRKECPGKQLHVSFIPLSWHIPVFNLVLSYNWPLSGQLWVSLCQDSMAGRGLGTEPPMSTLILFKEKIRNSKISGQLMPAKRVLSEPRLSIRVPEAQLVIFSSKNCY